ncbi:MAG: hypothetical protein M5U07_19595 [Xanthobacteraceae bacterium]|nr:hypothetical protein [Xanthobacteraceae bacterium]
MTVDPSLDAPTGWGATLALRGLARDGLERLMSVGRAGQNRISHNVAGCATHRSACKNKGGTLCGKSVRGAAIRAGLHFFNDFVDNRPGYVPRSLYRRIAVSPRGRSSEQHSMAHVVRARLPSISIVVLSLLAASAVSAVAASSGASVPTPRPRPSLIADGAVPAREFPSLSAAEFARLREAIRFTRDGALEPARDHASRIEDRAARTLLEWLMLRSDASALSFSRYAAFLQAHPAWPGRRILQRRAEASLWSGPHEPGTVLAFFADREPIGAPGKLALARALAAGASTTKPGASRGRSGATKLSRRPWKRRSPRASARSSRRATTARAWRRGSMRRTPAPRCGRRSGSVRPTSPW